ncbi:MAG: hypothetical protein NUV80_02430 [Candidatus Berkelbacteria bacterium]|nr:hypothetical protein [Candidatus Berkelbacteria bacterium]
MANKDERLSLTTEAEARIIRALNNIDTDKIEGPVVKALTDEINNWHNTNCECDEYSGFTCCKHARLRALERALPLARELVAKLDEKDKELARLRFRVKHDTWPPAGLPESEWERR